MKDLSDGNYDLVSLYSLPGLDSITQEFFAKYGCQNIFVSPHDSMPRLKPTKDRVCKFCGLDASKTKFKSKPHIIPYFLGNKYGISDFECDTQH